MSLRHMAVADYIYTELIRQTDLSSHIQSGGIMGRAEKKRWIEQKMREIKRVRIHLFSSDEDRTVEQSY